MSTTEKIDPTKKILQVAEELFAEKGFNGTSVNMIAEKAGVNKALIYYYFKDKNDIVNSLFENIVQESNNELSQHVKSCSYHNQNKIRAEINFLLKKQKVLSVMLMESLKGDNQNNYFFQCAKSVIKHARDDHMETSGEMERKYSPEMLRTLVYEFFTGFVPIVSLIVFRDKWCDYFKCSTDELMEYFLDSFHKTHLASKKCKCDS